MVRSWVARWGCPCVVAAPDEEGSIPLATSPVVAILLGLGQAHVVAGKRSREFTVA